MVDHDVTLYAQWEPIMTTMPATGSRTLAWLAVGGIALPALTVGIGLVVRRVRSRQ